MGVPYSSMQAFLLHLLGLNLQEVILENQPALLNSTSQQDFITWDSSR